MAEPFTVAAIQAAYVLMDREQTLSKVEQLIGEATALDAQLIVFPEVFVPGTPSSMRPPKRLEAPACRTGSLPHNDALAP